ncbi:MAG: outer membrane beta-barrel protein [Woeseiaceae bacterium]
MKINFLSMSLIPLTLLFVAESASAQGKAGWAVNLGVGVSQVKDRDGTESFNANDLGFIVGGEYRFNNHFALGLNAFSLGSPEDDFNSVNTSIEVRGFDLVLRFILPVADSVDVFALAGTAGYTADLEPGGNNGLFGEDAAEYGLGLDFGTGDRFDFRLAGRYYDGPRDESGALTTAGFNYRF